MAVLVLSSAPAAGALYPDRGGAASLSGVATVPAADDAVGAALAWSGLLDVGGAQVVVLARDDIFADALASGAVQGRLGAPLLLTDGDELDQRVEAELDRLGTTDVLLLGGAAAMSSAVEDRLVDLGLQTDRIGGPTRVETAAQIASTLFPEATAAILTRGFADANAADPTQAFADSLAAGGAAARSELPILLSHSTTLSTATRAHLEASAISRVYMVGGPAALSSRIEEELTGMGIEVRRTGGDNRFATAVAVTTDFYLFPDPDLPPPVGSSFPPVSLLLEGQAPDAWAGGFSAALAAMDDPIVLANGDGLPTATFDHLYPSFSGATTVVCGPQTSATACRHAHAVTTARNVSDPTTIHGVLASDAAAADPDQVGEPSGEVFLYRTDDPTTFCYALSDDGFRAPATSLSIVSEGADGIVRELTLDPPQHVFDRRCRFDLDVAEVDDLFGNPASHLARITTLRDGTLEGRLFRPARDADGTVIGVGAQLSHDSDPDRFGQIFIFRDADAANRICYSMFYGSPDAVTDAHIARGPAEDPGDVVHRLRVPEYARGGGSGSFCDTLGDVAIVDHLFANAANHHVQMRSGADPNTVMTGTFSF